MYSVNESFFFKGKKSCVVGGEERVLGGCLNFRISKLHNCTSETPTPRSHRAATEKQGRGSDGSLLVLSGQRSPGQGGSGDVPEDAVLPSSHRDGMPSLSYLRGLKAADGVKSQAFVSIFLFGLF